MNQIHISPGADFKTHCSDWKKPHSNVLQSQNFPHCERSKHTHTHIGSFLLLEFHHVIKISCISSAVDHLSPSRTHRFFAPREKAVAAKRKHENYINILSARNKWPHKIGAHARCGHRDTRTKSNRISLMNIARTASFYKIYAYIYPNEPELGPVETPRRTKRLTMCVCSPARFSGCSKKHLLPAEIQGTRRMPHHRCLG